MIGALAAFCRLILPLQKSEHVFYQASADAAWGDSKPADNVSGGGRSSIAVGATLA